MLIEDCEMDCRENSKNKACPDSAEQREFRYAVVNSFFCDL
jgi:hypothetical protein